MSAVDDPKYLGATGPWNFWFAWYPVSAYGGGGLLWLKMVKRRRCWIWEKSNPAGTFFSWWQYAPLAEMEAESSK